MAEDVLALRKDVSRPELLSLPAGGVVCLVAGADAFVLVVPGAELAQKLTAGRRMSSA